MNKNKNHQKQNNKNTEFAEEFASEASATYGKMTRNLVSQAEQKLAKDSGNNPTPDKDSLNK